MTVEYKLTFAKDGLKIEQRIESGIATPVFTQEKRLQSTQAETQAVATSKTGGGVPKSPGGPGGTGFDPGSAAVTLIGPIVITTCPCCSERERKQEHDPDGQ